MPQSFISKGGATPQGNSDLPCDAHCLKPIRDPFILPFPLCLTAFHPQKQGWCGSVHSTLWHAGHSVIIFCHYNQRPFRALDHSYTMTNLLRDIYHMIWSLSRKQFLEISFQMMSFVVDVAWKMGVKDNGTQNNEDVVYMHYGITCSHNKVGVPANCENMGRPWGY